MSRLGVIALTVTGFLLAGCGSPRPSRTEEPAPPRQDELPPQPVQRRPTLDMLKERGAVFEVDESIPGRPVIKVDLGQKTVRDAELAALRDAPGLRELSLYGVQEITDAGLEHLKGMSQLQLLDLNQSTVTGAGLVHLKDLTGLRTLDLARIEVGNAGLKHLQGLVNLESLNLHATDIGDDGLACLAGLTQLRELRIDDNQAITDKGLAHLAGLTNLQTLYLQSTGITDAGLAHLKGMTRLRQLTLSETGVSDAGIEALRKALPQLKVEH